MARIRTIREMGGIRGYLVPREARRKEAFRPPESSRQTADLPQMSRIAQIQTRLAGDGMA
jgi:hypothetical protein